MADAIRIAQRTRRIALESIGVGMGLSLVAMVFAAAGYIAPVAGALLQEGIDVLVILNALRALGGRMPDLASEPGVRALAQGPASVHRALRSRVSELAALAVQLDTLAAAEARSRLEQVREMLEKDWLPHESEEQQSAYPVIERMLKDENPTGPLIHTHYEIRRLSRLFGRLVRATRRATAGLGSGEGGSAGSAPGARRSARHPDTSLRPGR